MPDAIAFHLQTTDPVDDFPKPERLLVGNPRRTTWNHYSNDSQEVFAGEWQCEVGSWRIVMGPREDELFVVQSGRCRLTSDSGHSVEVCAGQSLLIPAGFSGVFAVLEPMRKSYMIVERRA